MRKPLIAANWKMHNIVSQSSFLVKRLKELLRDIGNREVVIFPPFTSLETVSIEIENTNIKLGAQNMHYEIEGAFTGEISAVMLKNLGCRYVILGHSERRQYFGESSELINRKIKTALRNNLNVILCIGETLTEREQNKTRNKIKNQLEQSLRNISRVGIFKITIAYEPIWAIGTGVNATPEQAEEVHVYIRGLLSGKYGKAISEKIRIIYGGSVKPDNIKSLMKENDIDGALVGGASLNAINFADIVNY